MAVIDQRGLVDDGTDSLTVAGPIASASPLSSSAGSFAELTTFNNNLFGQNLGAPTAFSQITQWLTASTVSPNTTVLASASNGQANNSIAVTQPGVYFHNVAMSFSGSAGTYTFALFLNGTQGATLQTTIAAGQPFPVSVTIADLDFHGSDEVPVVHDIRVKCSNAGANFQLNYGTFDIFRVVG